MAQLHITSQDIQAFLKGDFKKFLDAQRHAAEKHDYDSGWVTLPNNGNFKHGLGVLPHRYYAWASNSKVGDPYSIVTGTITVSSQNITIPTNLSYTYYRIFADR